MSSMRQRLLLVAGWAAAAVVATLVSTGAVAVAGGQVTDRPLRPLSASEVAALTDECGSIGRAPCLRQLENSASSTTTVTAAPELDLSPEGGEDGVSPTLPAFVTAPSPQDELDPDLEFDESLLPHEQTLEVELPGARVEFVDLVGGRVSVSGADGQVRIIWLIPRHGFAVLPVAGSDNLPDHVTVLLSDGSHQSTLVASWDDREGLVIETREGRFELNPR